MTLVKIEREERLTVRGERVSEGEMGRVCQKTL